MFLLLHLHVKEAHPLNESNIDGSPRCISHRRLSGVYKIALSSRKLAVTTENSFDPLPPKPRRAAFPLKIGVVVGGVSSEKERGTGAEKTAGPD